MLRKSVILSLFSIFVFALFANSAFAAGYSCPTYKKYTSCASGYYMTQTASSTACYTTAVAQNACRPCSTFGTGYTCAGGTACPVAAQCTTAAGYYMGSGDSYQSCTTACPDGRWCPGSVVCTFGASCGSTQCTTVGSSFTTSCSTRTANTTCQAAITLSANGGSGGPTSLQLRYNNGWATSSCGTVYGAGTTISGVSAPTRTGYTFTGYYTASSGGTKLIDNTMKPVSGTLTTNITATVYAQWTRNACGSGITSIRTNGYTIPLYAAKSTTPSINIQYNGTTCYADLTTSAVSGTINIVSSGTTYRAVK
jgi:uncharacterized repeat protein (TIGR02543 family)